MTLWCTILKKFIANQNGATAIEYGLIAALIAVVIITCADHHRHQPQHPLHLDRHVAALSICEG